MKIIAIAAVDKNGAIGKDGKLLFDSKEDMRHFYQKTKGCIVLMGRKTFQSIGKPLKNRINVVLTRNPDFEPDGVKVFYSLQAFLDAYKDSEATVFVIGGGEIYEATKHLWRELFLTVFPKEAKDADTFFPKWYDDNWSVIGYKAIPDQNGEIEVKFTHYKKG